MRVMLPLLMQGHPSEKHEATLGHTGPELPGVFRAWEEGSVGMTPSRQFLHLVNTLDIL